MGAGDGQRLEHDCVVALFKCMARPHLVWITGPGCRGVCVTVSFILFQEFNMRVCVLAVITIAGSIAANAAPISTPAVLAPVGGGGLLMSSYGGASFGTPTDLSGAVSDTSGTYSGSVQLGNDPQISSSLSTGYLPPSSCMPLGCSGGSSEVGLLYEFAVNGPANQTISVDLASIGTAAVSTLGSGLNLNSSAQLQIYLPDQYLAPLNGATLMNVIACAGAPDTYSSLCDSTSGPLSSGFNIAQTLQVQTNTPYVVRLYATNSILAGPSGTTGQFSASSSIDPTIRLDTTDPAYSLDFSPGLIGANPTPEPASLLLVGSGMVGAFSFGRRRSALREH